MPYGLKHFKTIGIIGTHFRKTVLHFIVKVLN